MNQNRAIHIGLHAQVAPDRAAIIIGSSGAKMTYAELDLYSKRLACYLRKRGLPEGAEIAIMMENCAEFLVALWAAQRAGLRYTPINWHLAPAEVLYIIQDCGAKALLVSAGLENLVGKLGEDLAHIGVKAVAGGMLSGFDRIEAICRDSSVDQEVDPTLDKVEGTFVLYSSGTTGRPKGIRRIMPLTPWGTPNFFEVAMERNFGVGPSTIFLSPAPLYHAAPLGWSMGVLRLGGTVILMEKFDSIESLRMIERYKVTHAQYVPTMFVRMLKLSEEERSCWDLSSLKMAIHVAAPCPPEVKKAMFDWFGPIIFEYYGGSEGNGVVAIGPQDWLAHPGSLGRAIAGQVHIVGENGEELPAGEIGTIYFSGLPPFEYHNDPEKTASVFNDKGWSTLGDLGLIDKDGFLYLSDRRTDLIISGGVNIYPREVEEALLQHPSVMDVAVIGVSNEEFGKEVKAVVELREKTSPSAELEQELILFCRERIAHFKCPKSVEFGELPRSPAGKMLKRNLIDRYQSTAGV